MTRSVYEKNYYRLAGRAILPIRWMAPETFYGKFAISSDIWAFGVTCWEILTLARIRPYNDMGDRDVIENAVSGKDRKLLSRPNYCDDQTFKLMKECWCDVPEQRPQFCDIYSRLRHFAAGQDR
jgi:serine/threonine protein kinase